MVWTRPGYQHLLRWRAKESSYASLIREAASVLMSDSMYQGHHAPFRAAAGVP